MKFLHVNILALSLSLAACATSTSTDSNYNPAIVSGFEYNTVGSEDTFVAVPAGETVSIEAACGEWWYATGGAYTLDSEATDFVVVSAGVFIPEPEIEGIEALEDAAVAQTGSALDADSGLETETTIVGESEDETVIEVETEVDPETWVKDNGAYALTVKNMGYQARDITLSVEAVCIKFQ